MAYTVLLKPNMSPPWQHLSGCYFGTILTAERLASQVVSDHRLIVSGFSFANFVLVLRVFVASVRNYRNVTWPANCFSTVYRAGGFWEAR